MQPEDARGLQPDLLVEQLSVLRALCCQQLHLVRCLCVGKRREHETSDARVREVLRQAVQLSVCLVHRLFSPNRLQIRSHVALEHHA